MKLEELRRKMKSLADPERAVQSRRFFKTGPGEYGEGDRFLGLTVPQTRSFLTDSDTLGERDVLALLHSPWHEERLLALLILVRRFAAAKKQESVQARIVEFYLANTNWINNWDLVDSSAPHILGAWLLRRDRQILNELAASNDLWQQRIAVLTTLCFIRADDFADTLTLCRKFLTHKHDLIHKACGWMLREIGNRDSGALTAFLDRHAADMPRTMLRYAIEKLDATTRKCYLAQR